MAYLIRDVGEGDIPALAHIHLTSKKEAEKGIVDQAFLDAKTHEEYIEKWTKWVKAEDTENLLAFEGEHAVGTITFGKLQTPPPGTSHIRPVYSSEIMALYVLPDAWGKGIGSVLFKEAVKKLLEKKHVGMCLWALDKNKRACGFYERMGGQRCGKQMIETGRAKVKEVCYGWRDLTAWKN